MKDVYYFNESNKFIYKCREEKYWCRLDTELLLWIPIIDPTGVHWFNPTEISKEDIKELLEIK
jgi:hypothetical protein